MIKNVALPKGNRGFLLLAFLLAALAAVLVVVYLNSVGDDGGSGGGGAASGPVVVAGQDIAAGTRISASMVILETVPSGERVSGALSSLNAVVGSTAGLAISEGEQITAANISTTDRDAALLGDDPPLSLVIPQGMRAVSVKIDEVTAVGGLIRPGDYVDVIMAEAINDSSAINTCYVVQDVKVLAIAQDVQVAAASGQGSQTPAGPADNNPEAGSATLQVTPQKATSLIRALEQGEGQKLWLVLRPFGEHGEAGVGQCPF